MVRAGIQNIKDPRFVIKVKRVLVRPRLSCGIKSGVKLRDGPAMLLVIAIKIPPLMRSQMKLDPNVKRIANTAELSPPMSINGRRRPNRVRKLSEIVLQIR